MAVLGEQRHHRQRTSMPAQRPLFPELVPLSHIQTQHNWWKKCQSYLNHINETTKSKFVRNKVCAIEGNSQGIRKFVPNDIRWGYLPEISQINQVEDISELRQNDSRTIVSVGVAWAAGPLKQLVATWSLRRTFTCPCEKQNIEMAKSFIKYASSCKKSVGIRRYNASVASKKHYFLANPWLSIEDEGIKSDDTHAEASNSLRDNSWTGWKVPRKFCKQEQKSAILRSRQQRPQPQDHRRNGSLLHASQIPPLLPPRLQPWLWRPTTRPLHVKNEDVQKEFAFPVTTSEKNGRCSGASIP